MQIARVHIENYRSIRMLDVYPNRYWALIGENNVGKSNILKAINLVLGEMWPTDRTLTQDDFYRKDTEHDILIQVYFDQPLDIWRNMSLKVHGFELRGKAYKRSHRGMPKGTLTVGYNCIDAKGETIKYPAEPLQEGKSAKIWYDLKVSRDLKDHIPFIYIDVMRDYHRHDPANRWSALRRLLNQINTEIAYDRALFKVMTPAGEEKMTRKQAFEYKLLEAYSYLKNQDLIEMEARIQKNTLDQMGLSQEDVVIHLAAYDPVNVTRNLNIFVDEMGVYSSADMVGAGMQNAIVMAILRTYEEMKKDGAIFAIEGPETYLHPHQERHFHEVLHSLSRDNQVLITTHSQEFVTISCPEEVCLIRRTPAEGTLALFCTEEQMSQSLTRQLEFLNCYDTHRNDLFFARGVILVEGAAEKQFILYIAHRLGLDLDQAGVSVIDCAGVENICLYKRVADAFDIAWVGIISKRDMFPGEISNWANGLIGKTGDKCLFLIPVQERAGFGLPSNPNEFRDAMQYHDASRIEDIDPSLAEAIKTVIQEAHYASRHRERDIQTGMEGDQEGGDDQ